MITPTKHQIESRPYTIFASVEDELKISAASNYLFDLSYLSVLDVIGDRSVEFLQGQLSCDVTKVNDIQMIQGAQCNLKGRILSLLDIIKWKGIKLIVPHDLLETTQNSLEKTALLSRVKLQPNPSLKVYGYLHQSTKDILPLDANYFSNALHAFSYAEQSCHYHLGNGFYIFIIDSKDEETLIEQFADKNQLLGSLTWHTLRLTNHQIEIYPESRGLFLPHRLNLHKSSFLSFDKGCYKGQEIIARTHYRATLKHDLRFYKLINSQALKIGMKLTSFIDNTEVGELVDYSILDNDSYIVCLSHLNSIPEQLCFENGHGTIELIALG